MKKNSFLLSAATALSLLTANAYAAEATPAQSFAAMLTSTLRSNPVVAHHFPTDGKQTLVLAKGLAHLIADTEHTAKNIELVYEALCGIKVTPEAGDDDVSSLSKKTMLERIRRALVEHSTLLKFEPLMEEEEEEEDEDDIDGSVSETGHDFGEGLGFADESPAHSQELLRPLQLQASARRSTLSAIEGTLATAQGELAAFDEIKRAVSAQIASYKLEIATAERTLKAATTLTSNRIARARAQAAETAMKDAGLLILDRMRKIEVERAKLPNPVAYQAVEDRVTNLTERAESLRSDIALIDERIAKLQEDAAE